MDKIGSRAIFDAQFPAELESVVSARRLLSRAVAGWGLPEPVRQDAALAVSELVTNSVLHAGTPVRLSIRRKGAGVRVEVRDGSSHLPPVEAVRPEELLHNRSMTGRGLALVAATSDRWGSEPVAHGKVTWAEVGTGELGGDPDPVADFPPAPPAPAVCASAAAAGRPVHLVGVPVALLVESIQQMSDLQREVQVMSMGRPSAPELDQVLQAGRPWVLDIDLWTDSDRRTAESAAAAGAETIDFDVMVPDDIALRIDGVAAWLRKVASSIMRRQLLTLPASAEVVAYRRWYGEEILRQLGGNEPQPCPVRERAHT